MQIVKRDRNNQRRKNKRIHVRKMNLQGSMARKLKTTISLVRPFDGEEFWGISWPLDTMDVSAGCHAAPSQNKRLGKMQRPKIRCHGPARWQNISDNYGEPRASLIGYILKA